MVVNAEKIIVRRLLQELKETRSVALGPGIPTNVAALLPDEVECVNIQASHTDVQQVDVAVVEAAEVSERGDLAFTLGAPMNGVRAGRWIVAAPLLRENGEARIVKKCQFPVERLGCVSLIITEYGVIGVSPVGFELLELSPGVASDDVRMRVNASIHVVDGIQRLKLG